MKKLILVVAGAILLAACSGKEDSTDQKKKDSAPSAPTHRASKSFFGNKFPPCTIDGHDCWKVVQLAAETEENNEPEADSSAPQAPSDERHIKRKPTRYKNPKLEQIGLTVIRTNKFLDDKENYYKLSNGVTISQMRSTKNSKQGWDNTEVSFPTFETFLFNNKGKVIDHTPAPDCLVNHLQCTRLAIQLNRFFTDKPNLQKTIDKTGKIKGERYVKRVCDGKNCKTNFVKSDWQLVGISPDQRQQQGETYTYTLNDGRTVIFNWEPDSPEHGYLTVTETDGTQKKFDSQGKRVN